MAVNTAHMVVYGLFLRYYYYYYFFGVIIGFCYFRVVVRS